MKLVDKPISFTCLVDEIISFTNQVLLETEVSREVFPFLGTDSSISFTDLGGSRKKNHFF
jgi:hypothetical protein